MQRIILPPELIRKIHKGQKRLTDLLPDLDKCEQCGMEIQKFRDIVADQLAVLQQIDKNFNPNYMPPTPQSPSIIGQSEA